MFTRKGKKCIIQIGVVYSSYLTRISRQAGDLDCGSEPGLLTAGNRKIENRQIIKEFCNILPGGVRMKTMKKTTWNKVIAMLMALVMVLSVVYAVADGEKYEDYEVMVMKFNPRKGTETLFQVLL